MLSKAVLLSSAAAAVSAAAIGNKATLLARDVNPFDCSRTYAIVAAGAGRPVVHEYSSLTLETDVGFYTDIKQFAVTDQGDGKYSLAAADYQPNAPIQIQGAQEGSNINVGKEGNPTTFEFHAVDKPESLGNHFDYSCFLIKVPDQNLAWDAATDQDAQYSISANGNQDDNNTDTDNTDTDNIDTDNTDGSNGDNQTDNSSSYSKRDQRQDPYVQLAAVDYGKTSQKFCFRDAKPWTLKGTQSSDDGSDDSATQTDSMDASPTTTGYADATATGSAYDGEAPDSSVNDYDGTQTSSAYDNEQTGY